MTDAGLRDALENLVESWRETSSKALHNAADDLQDFVLDKYPAEPAPDPVLEGGPYRTAMDVARNIVNQLADLWEVPVDVRQETNDRCDAFVAGLIARVPAEPVGVSDATSLGLTRPEIRAEVDELIRNAYAEGWREAKQRPDTEPPVLEIDWAQPGGVRITELWCVCDVQGSALSASCKVHGSAS